MAGEQTLRFRTVASSVASLLAWGMRTPTIACVTFQRRPCRTQMGKITKHGGDWVKDGLVWKNTGGGGNSVRGFFRRGKFRMGKITHLPNLQCIGSKRDPEIAIPKRSWEKAMTIVPEITSVDGVARHSQIIRLPAPPSLLVDNNCRRAGTKQMGARGEAQGIRWYGGLHGQNSARGKFRTSPRKMRGKFRTKLKYGIFPAEKSPRGISPRPVLLFAHPPVQSSAPCGGAESWLKSRSGMA